MHFEAALGSQRRLQLEIRGRSVMLYQPNGAPQCSRSVSSGGRWERRGGVCVPEHRCQNGLWDVGEQPCRTDKMCHTRGLGQLTTDYQLARTEIEAGGDGGNEEA